MPMLDRKEKVVVSHRIACGRPGATAPVRLDYLEITTTEQAKAGEAFKIDTAAMDRLPSLGNYLADKPRRVPIRALSDDIDDFLIQEYQSRVKMPRINKHGEIVRDDDGKATQTELVTWCSGDGRKARRMTGAMRQIEEIQCCSSPFDFTPNPYKDLVEILRKTDGRKQNPNDGRRCPYAQNDDYKAGPTCKPDTTLLVLCDAVSNIGAMCKVRSHGHDTADSLRSSLLAIKRQMPGGVLAYVPLDLVLQMKQKSNPTGKGSQLQPVLHVELRTDVETTLRLLEGQLQARTRMLGTVEQYHGLLAAARAELGGDDSDEFPAHKMLNAPGGQIQG